MKFLYKLFLYILFLAFIFYLSYYCTLFTMSFLPFSNRLIHLTSNATAANNQFRNLLFTNLLRARPSTLNLINLPFYLPLIVARKIIPPFDKVCHKIGDILNFLKNKSLNTSTNIQLDQTNIADIQLPSFSDVEQESQNWSLHGRESHLRNKISLSTLNFIGCLIFMLIFILYLFIFTSLFIFFLDRIIQSVDNLKIAFEKMNPSLIKASKSKELPVVTSDLNTKKFNKNPLKTYNVDFIEY